MRAEHGGGGGTERLAAPGALTPWSLNYGAELSFHNRLFLWGRVRLREVEVFVCFVLLLLFHAWRQFDTLVVLRLSVWTFLAWAFIKLLGFSNNRSPPPPPWSSSLSSWPPGWWPSSERLSASSRPSTPDPPGLPRRNSSRRPTTTRCTRTRRRRPPPRGAPWPGPALWALSMVLKRPIQKRQPSTSGSAGWTGSLDSPGTTHPSADSSARRSPPGSATRKTFSNKRRTRRCTPGRTGATSAPPRRSSGRRSCSRRTRS